MKNLDSPEPRRWEEPVRVKSQMSTKSLVWVLVGFAAYIGLVIYLVLSGMPEVTNAIDTQP
jgi:hypothetical protein